MVKSVESRTYMKNNCQRNKTLLYESYDLQSRTLFTKQHIIAGIKLQQRRSSPLNQRVGLGLDLTDDVLRGGIGGCIVLSHLHIASTGQSRESSTDFFQVQGGMVNSRERQGNSGTCDQLRSHEALDRLPVAELPHERPKSARLLIRRKHCAVHQRQGRLAGLGEVPHLRDPVLQGGQQEAPG